MAYGGELHTPSKCASPSWNSNTSSYFSIPSNRIRSTSTWTSLQDRRTKARQISWLRRGRRLVTVSQRLFPRRLNRRLMLELSIHLPYSDLLNGRAKYRPSSKRPLHSKRRFQMPETVTAPAYVRPQIAPHSHP